MAEAEEKEKKPTTSRKAVIKKNKVKVVLIGNMYIFYKNKNGRLSWMPIPKSSKQIKVGDEIEI